MEAALQKPRQLIIPMTFIQSTWMGVAVLVLLAGGETTEAAKEPPLKRERSIYEDVVLESIGKGSFAVVACPFAVEMKKLSPEKYLSITDYAVVKKLNGKLEFGAKFKVAFLVEGALEERSAAQKSNLGDFQILVLFDQPHADRPFEAAHALPYSKDFETDVTKQIRKEKAVPDLRPPPKRIPVK
jgi:hypothetical protein